MVCSIVAVVWYSIVLVCCLIMFGLCVGHSSVAMLLVMSLCVLRCVVCCSFGLVCTLRKTIMIHNNNHNTTTTNNNNHNASSNTNDATVYCMILSI